MSETGVNAYKKAEVICAAKNVIQKIELARLQAKPNKRPGIFSKLFSTGSIDISQYLYGRQYTTVQRILRVAGACEGSTINLSNEEFDSISSEYAPIT